MGLLYSAELDQTLIQQQLDKIINSDEFRGTSRSKRFLSYLVEQSLNGNSAKLKGYSLGIDVFDKDIDFDPKIDPIVRVQAGKLRQRLDLYYSKSGKEDETRILIPKGTYSPVFEITHDPNSYIRNKTEFLTRSNAVSPKINSHNNGIVVMPFKYLNSDSDK